MSLAVDLLLLVHVLAGVVALVTALVAALTKKGARFHRKVGSAFFWSMLGVGVTAIPVTFVRPNPFLFFIALFSFYMALAGYRRGKSRFEHTAFDVWAAVAMILTAFVMVGFGLSMVAGGEPLGWALVAFGGLGASFGIEDVVDSRRPRSHSEKVRVHLSRMLGGTIATITAVLVQQVAPLLESQLAQLVLWLSPTVILTPLIFVWNQRIASTGKYRLFASKGTDTR